MNYKNSIEALIDEIKVVLSKEGSRFTADDIEVLKNVIRELEKLGRRKRRKVEKGEIVEIICQLLKFFLCSEVIDKVKHLF